MGINFFYAKLPNNVNGFFLNSEKDQHIILINNSLDKKQSEIVCAHELAHSLLHSNINSIKVDDCNSKLIEQCEKEAELFTDCLLNYKKDLDNLEL